MDQSIEDRYFLLSSGTGLSHYDVGHVVCLKRSRGYIYIYIYLYIYIYRKYQLFPLLSYFPWLCEVVHSVECVSRTKSILSIIFHAIYGAVCIQLTYISDDYCKNICTLSYHHNQIGSMTHLPLVRVRLWNNGTRCMSLLYHSELKLLVNCHVFWFISNISNTMILLTITVLTFLVGFMWISWKWFEQIAYPEAAYERNVDTWCHRSLFHNFVSMAFIKNLIRMFMV